MSTATAIPAPLAGYRERESARQDGQPFFAGPRSTRDPMATVIVMRAPEIRVAYRGNGPKSGEDLFPVHEYPLLARLYRFHTGSVSIPEEQLPLPNTRTVREYNQAQWDAEVERLTALYTIPMERGNRNFLHEVYGQEGNSTLAAKAKAVFERFREMTAALVSDTWITKAQIQELIAIVEPQGMRGQPLLMEERPFVDPNRKPADPSPAAPSKTEPPPATGMTEEHRKRILAAAVKSGVPVAKARQFLQTVDRIGSANLKAEDWAAANILDQKDHDALLRAFAEAF